MVGFSKQGKKTLSNHTYLNDSASKTFVATILVAYVTILSEPELSLQIRFEYQKKPYNQKIINREYTVLSWFQRQKQYFKENLPS